MTVHRQVLNAVVILILAAWFAPSTLHAQDYPSRPVRMVVPYAAGTTTDILARQLADRAITLLVAIYAPAGTPEVIVKKLAGVF